MLMYNLKDRKEVELGDIGSFEISADRKKMLIASGGKYSIIDLPKSKVTMKDTLDLSGMEVNLDKRKQWGQIFNECWRQMREFFYVPNMHGVDWPAMRKRYAPLVAHVNHRADLAYIIGEMIGELNVGHTYVGGGEYPKPKRMTTQSSPSFVWSPTTPPTPTIFLKCGRVVVVATVIGGFQHAILGG